jgi:hypothetical protein
MLRSRVQGSPIFGQHGVVLIERLETHLRVEDL